MRLYDTSHYNSNESISNYLIEVLPVNTDRWKSFNVARGFSLVLNSSNLGYKKAQENTDLIALPDGIYEIKQSVKPNTLTANHFLHFRIVNLLISIECQRGDLFSNKCDLSREDFWLNRDKLREIEEYAYAAKWIVEEDGDKIKGKELYGFAKKLLEEYTNECKC